MIGPSETRRWLRTASVGRRIGSAALVVDGLHARTDALTSLAVGVGERLLDGVDPVLLDQARPAAASVTGVQEAGEIRARWVGHRPQADVRLTVDRRLDVAAAHEIVEEAHRAMLEALPVLEAAVIHVDPCRHDGSDPHH